MPHKLSFSPKRVVLTNTWGKTTSKKMPSSNMSRSGWTEPPQETHTLKFKSGADSFFCWCADWSAGYTSRIFLSRRRQLSSNHINKNRYVMSLRYPEAASRRRVTHYRKGLRTDQLLGWQPMCCDNLLPSFGVCNIGWTVTDLNAVWKHKQACSWRVRRGENGDRRGWQRSRRTWGVSSWKGGKEV